ncbi:MAG: type II glyceraldehyde-3-phosphate dehydrogenase, partial [Anaerolineales bacterium]
LQHIDEGGDEMSKVRVAVAGYGTIGARLADGVVRQEDMELVGVADVAPTLLIRALHESGMPYRLFLVDPKRKPEFDELGIPVSGTFEELLDQVDVVLDAAPAGIGAKNKELSSSMASRQFSKAGKRDGS